MTSWIFCFYVFCIIWSQLLLTDYKNWIWHLLWMVHLSIISLIKTIRTFEGKTKLNAYIMMVLRSVMMHDL